MNILWEELNALDFPKACELAQSTCIVPFGVMEKHGDHLPLYTDVFIGRRLAINAAKMEYSVIFPDYYFGQISVARYAPGTISIKHELAFALLENICEEIARNGFTKIIFLNAHGGNIHLLRHFIQSTLHAKKDYIVYELSAMPLEKDLADVYEILGSNNDGDHAGELETSIIMADHPELVQLSNVTAGDWDNRNRIGHLEEIYTAIRWYADYPSHFAGDPSAASEEKGRRLIELFSTRIARQISLIKKDDAALAVQNEFFRRCSGLNL